MYQNTATHSMAGYRLNVSISMSPFGFKSGLQGLLLQRRNSQWGTSAPPPFSTGIIRGMHTRWRSGTTLYRYDGNMYRSYIVDVVEGCERNLARLHLLKRTIYRPISAYKKRRNKCARCARVLCHFPVKVGSHSRGKKSGLCRRRWQNR